MLKDLTVLTLMNAQILEIQSTIKVTVENIPSVRTHLDPSAALVILDLKSLLVGKAVLI